ncbi:hypothetical protein KR52_08800 [Synechococcus sp. KORDI-52]|uniref:hypothetical protein n=1 Tax=Synechococcus sp. KORDI-52 TaxID=585425 RepID=UPI0004E0537B|nr:hypothetical protein [Synechococcus sp. KORDI-52]AII49241.1 hypothetical protein KR52_08800 [Synechococcus sp. KORDI-52]
MGSATITEASVAPEMTQPDDSIAIRLSRIEMRLETIEALLLNAREQQARDAIPTQDQCYEAWIHYLNNNPEAIDEHLSVHEMAALKASIHAPIPKTS